MWQYQMPIDFPLDCSSLLGSPSSEPNSPKDGFVVYAGRALNYKNKIAVAPVLSTEK